jgi:hypothetical protein
VTYFKFIVIARCVCISLSLMCFFVGTIMPPVHMLGGIPVAMTFFFLVPWDRFYEVWLRRRKRKLVMRRRRRAGDLERQSVSA